MPCSPLPAPETDASAHHACLSGANILERLTGIPTFTQVASEFRYCDPIVDEKTMCVFVSQSGETADTMAALRLAKEKDVQQLQLQTF